MSQLADSGAVFEVKAGYAKEMVTAFIKLNGVTIGAVANRSEVYGEDGTVTDKFEPVLTPAGCDKAAEFITNVKGFKADKCSEKKIAKAAAKLTYAFADATVPKVNVVIGQAYGSAYVTMNSKAIGADITMAWPDAQIGTMDAKLAAKIICDGQGAEKIEACAKGYVDQIIEPAATRKYLIGAFEMLLSKREDRPAKKHGTV